jgi:hypothetical protein
MRKQFQVLKKKLALKAKQLYLFLFMQKLPAGRAATSLAQVGAFPDNKDEPSENRLDEEIPDEDTWKAVCLQIGLADKPGKRGVQRVV